MFVIAYEESDYDHHECDPFLYVETEAEAERLCSVLKNQNDIKSARKVRRWLRENEPEYNDWLNAKANDNPYFDSWAMRDDETMPDRIARKEAMFRNACKQCGIIDWARFDRILNYRTLEIGYHQRNHAHYVSYKLEKYELTPS